MKCIQIIGQGIPVRMSDDDAFQIVERDKDGEYCPKSVWREHCAGEYMMERGGRSAGYCRLNGNKIESCGAGL